MKQRRAINSIIIVIMEVVTMVGFGMMGNYGYGMMGNYGYGMMGYGGMFFGLLFWILIIVLAYCLIKSETFYYFLVFIFSSLTMQNNKILIILK